MCVCPSIRMYQLGSHRKNFRYIWYRVIYENLSRKLTLGWSWTTTSGILHEDIRTLYCLQEYELFCSSTTMRTAEFPRQQSTVLYRRQWRVAKNYKQNVLLCFEGSSLYIFYIAYSNINSSRIQNAYCCFSKSKTVKRTRQNVAFHVHCLSCLPVFYLATLNITKTV
jgi:hypothetical protein